MSDSKTNLTVNEIKALKACLNYESREDQLADNYSNGCMEVFKEALSWTDKQVSGLVSSLVQKELIQLDRGCPEIFWITEEGVNAVFDVIESEASISNSNHAPAILNNRADFIENHAVVMSMAVDLNIQGGTTVYYDTGRRAALALAALGVPYAEADEFIKSGVEAEKSLGQIVAQALQAFDVK